MLHVHRAARADVLADGLAGALAEPGAPAPDPFTPEVVAVHSRGIERWLMQRLSTRLGTSGDGDGVAANIEFPFPGRLVGDVLWRLAGFDEDADPDPWRPARLTWPVLDVLDSEHVELQPVQRQIADVPERRFGLARHLADLLDRYGAHRPEMVRAWNGGRHLDASGQPLGPDDRWQADLWRCVRARVGVPSPAERLELLDRIDDPEVSARLDGLPFRLHAFGLTAVPVAYVDVLAALGRQRDVHLWLLSPSRRLWTTVAEAADARTRNLPRSQDPVAERVRSPLLASWGRDVRELQMVVSSSAPRVHHLDEPDDAQASTLAVLQAAIRADARPPGRPSLGRRDERVPVPADDRSVQVHACWGAERQVEVLRDEILRLLAADETLEPRDILVMCPDVEQYAPIVQAVLTDVDTAETGLPDLRVRLADRSLQRVNPLLQVLADLLDIARDRISAAQVTDLIGRPPVARRFRMSAEDRERIGRWVKQLDVRWGLDERHRGAHGLPGVDSRTWRAALDRLLLGVALADEDHRVVAGVAAYEEVTADPELAGRLAELVDRLSEVVDELSTPRTVEEWRDALRDLVDAIAAVAPDEQGAADELARVLDGLVDEAVVRRDGETHPSEAVLSLPEITEALATRLRGRPSRANHRTGDLTVCTLVPMRAVPHRVVCLLGLDDGAFPRRTTRDGDDLLAREPRIGDRDPRTEDRQLLLDAVMSADQTLVVTYTARDLRTGDERPPAVPVAELLAAVRDSVRGEAGDVEPLRRHPLQPHAPAVFDGSHPRGFDRAALAAAQAAQRAHGRLPAIVDEPLPAQPLERLALSELIGFLEHPVRAFLRNRLGVRIQRVDETSDETVPAALGNLDRWQLTDELLAAERAGDADRWRAHLHGRDVLPPGQLGERLLAEIAERVDALLSVAHDQAPAAGPPERVPLSVSIDGVEISGAVDDVVGRSRLLVLTPSRVKAKHQLQLWVQLLALTAFDPGADWQGTLVGRDSGKSLLAVSGRVPGSDRRARAAFAERHLAVLVDLYRRGMRAPLPLYCATSHAFAEQAVGGAPRDEAAAAADKVWREDTFSPEAVDDHHLLALGDELTVDDLLAASHDEPWCPPDWEGGRSPFERYAWRLWKPVLDVLEARTYSPKQIAELADPEAA